MSLEIEAKAESGVANANIDPDAACQVCVLDTVEAKTALRINARGEVHFAVKPELVHGAKAYSRCNGHRVINKLRIDEFWVTKEGNNIEDLIEELRHGPRPQQTQT